MDLALPLFDDSHRTLAAKVKRLCDDRLGALTMTELEDHESAAIEYIALLGQEGLFDPALGRALEGEAPRPELRSLCTVRTALGRTSGLCDGVYGAQVQGMYPLALCGNEDQRAIFLPGMAAGQTLVGLALLDGNDPLVATGRPGGYILTGNKTLVPLAPIADQFVVLARHRANTPNEPPRYSMFVVDAGLVKVANEGFVSPLPVGVVSFDNVEIEAEHRLGGEGQGLMIAQTSLDMMRLPAAAGCLGIARQALQRGCELLLKRGIGGKPLREQQGSLWSLGDACTQLEAAEGLVANAAFRRDTTTSRESKGTTMARQLAQDAAEFACLTVADLMGLRGLSAGDPWTRLLAEVRALRLETEFLENARSTVALSFITSVEADIKKQN
ncbi:MAG TPA: acyl-CoA dehydrogenase family protein [Myxococcota bacterium]